jgi:rhodanese-related sulfurtransferase
MDGEISPDEVQDRLDSEDPPTVVDIRSATEFEREHIPGSENVPFAELPNRVTSLEDADHIVTVCPHGQASVQAARLVKSYEGTADATVESMAGGLEAWAGPLESGADESGERSTVAADEGPDAPF